jgi:hypothetical protein
MRVAHDRAQRRALDLAHRHDVALARERAPRDARRGDGGHLRAKPLRLERALDERFSLDATAARAGQSHDAHEALFGLDAVDARARALTERRDREDRLLHDQLRFGVGQRRQRARRMNHGATRAALR